MTKQYVEQRDGGYWIIGRRISLDSVVYAYIAGQTAESIAQSFPLLTMEEVYGAIAFYLANRAEIDAHLTWVKANYDEMHLAAAQSDPMFYQKLADAKGHGAVSRP